MTEQGRKLRKRILGIRRRTKKSKPSFDRPESWRYVRLKRNWRKPKGLDHKMRRSIKGWPATVSVGYRGPKIGRGLHPSGYEEVLICNTDQFAGIDPEKQAIRIAHTVGRRNRARIVSEARKKRITILNLKVAREVLEEEKKTTDENEEEEKVEAAETEKTKEKTETEKPKKRQTKKSKKET